jgi:hypothetical protein
MWLETVLCGYVPSCEQAGLELPEESHFAMRKMLSADEDTQVRETE